MSPHFAALTEWLSTPWVRDEEVLAVDRLGAGASLLFMESQMGDAHQRAALLLSLASSRGA